MRLLTTLTLLTICFTAPGQTFPKKKNGFYRADTSFLKMGKSQKPLTFYPGTYIDTEYRYVDSTGIVVIIQNSLPRGGGYTHPTGKEFQYRVFWNRIINETATPLELTINFPADSFAMLPSPDAYVKLFLPPDTMTLDKETLYDYGATGLKSFLDTGLNKPTKLQRTINPGEACLFYIVALFTEGRNGPPPRPELVLKGKDLFYRIKGVTLELDSEGIPCGQIVFKIKK